MSRSATMLRSSLLLAVLVGASSFVPAAAEASPASGFVPGVIPHSVGLFDVSSRGAGVSSARGEVTETTVTETTARGSGRGVLEGYSVLGSPVLDRLDIAGFSAARPLAGGGTAALRLDGSNAVVEAVDSINGQLLVRNRQESSLSVVAELAAGVVASASSSRAVHLRTPDGVEGDVLVVSTAGAAARGAFDTAALAAGSVRATLLADEALVFRAAPRYDGTAATRAAVASFTEATVRAIATGALAGEVTSEFRGTRSLFAEPRYDARYTLASDADVRGRVQTVLRAVAEGDARVGRVVAYDLDHPDLPAGADREVAVYVDGALAAAAPSAAEVAERGDLPTYFTSAVNGRTLALVNTGTAAEGAVQRTVTLVAVPDAALAARTLAELEAQLGVTSDVEGEFRDHSEGRATGDVVGEFATFVVSKTDASVHSFTLLDRGVEVFDRVAVEGEAATSAAVDAALASRYAVSGRLSELRLHDSATASLVAAAREAATVRYAFGEGVRGRLVDERVVELSDGVDVLGHLALVEGRSVEAAGNRLALDGHAGAVADLAAGASVVFRSALATESGARSRAVAQAIAAGELAGEVDVGVVGNAVESAEVAWTGDLDVRVAKAVRGEVVAAVRSEARSAAEAHAFLLASDRATLAAASPDDVVVHVRGEAAERASSAASAFATAASTGRAAFSVVTSARGASQVVVAVPQSLARAGVDVVVRSALQAESQAAAAVDLFGSLRLDSTTGAATGAIVSFVAKAQASAILDYTVTTQAASTTVFDAVVVGTGTFDVLSSVDAPSVRLVNPEATLEVFDTTSALLQTTAQVDTTAVFHLGAGIEAVERSSAVVLLDDVSGGARSTVGALVLTRADGTAATSSRLDAAAAGRVHAELEQGARLVFRAFSGFEAELDQARKEALADALAEGRVAGQAIFRSVGSAAETTITGSATMAFLATVDVATQTASAEKVEVVVASAQDLGRTLILSVDPATVSGLAEGKADLLVDGRATAQAASYADVLDATDDGGADEHWVHTTETGHQVLVSLGHFSLRTVTLQKPPAPNLFMFSTVALGLLVVGQAVVPRLRKGR